MSGKIWDDDIIQFTRLLAEISYLGLSREDTDALCESMDLEPGELESLFVRAEKRFELIKEMVKE